MMTWSRAWSYVALFVVLSCIRFSTSSPARPSIDEELASPGETAAIPFLAARPEDIEEMEIELSGRYAKMRRSGGRWEVLQPPGRDVATDLISALLAAVLEIPEVEVVGASDERAGKFGLESPAAELRLRPSDGRVLAIRLGALNPARTAVYAGGSGTRDVVLLGLNVRYYLDLAIEALFRDLPEES